MNCDLKNKTLYGVQYLLDKILVNLKFLYMVPMLAIGSKPMLCMLYTLCGVVIREGAIKSATQVTMFTLLIPLLNSRAFLKREHWYYQGIKDCLNPL